jgi:hypothetical protein
MPHITFIHGIANKPPRKDLEKIWINALSDDSLGNDDGFNPATYGITTSMIYWADVVYAQPLEGSLHESAASLESLENTVNKESEPSLEWMEDLHGKEREVMERLALKFLVDVENEATTAAGATKVIQEKLEAIPLPWPLKKRMMKVLLKDVHHYFFNYPLTPRPGETFMVQEEIRQRVIRELTSVQTDKHIVISHSMGTAIIYDCLLRLPECPPVDCLMTIGSPLGLDEVQRCLTPGWTRDNGFPEKIAGRWVNVYDPLDIVTGFDGNIANDFEKNGEEVIEIIREPNEGAWRHDITKYLKRPKLRAALRNLLDI